MNDYFSRFSESPVTFKKSFFMLLMAWICHPVFLYSLFVGGAALEDAHRDIMKMALISLSLCVLLLMVKKWARALVVLGNILILIYDLLYFFVAPINKLSTLLCVAVVLFTLGGTYWLFVKETRDYFTQVNPKIEPPDPLNPR